MYNEKTVNLKLDTCVYLRSTKKNTQHAIKGENRMPCFVQFSLQFCHTINN